MADAVRIISLQRGYDPREFALVSFGGAGPLHGAALAKELGIPTVLVPPRPGTWSALGCLMVDIRHDLSEMFLRSADDADDAELDAAFSRLEEEGRRLLESEGVPEEGRRLERSIAMRYLGQWRSLEVPVDADQVDLGAAVERFHAEHEREFSYRREDAPVELYRLQVAAVGATEDIQLPPTSPIGTRSSPSPPSAGPSSSTTPPTRTTRRSTRARTSRPASASRGRPSSTSSTRRRSSRPASAPRSTSSSTSA